jgi:hypothetical protein
VDAGPSLEELAATIDEFSSEIACRIRYNITIVLNAAPTHVYDDIMQNIYFRYNEPDPLSVFRWYEFVIKPFRIEYVNSDDEETTFITSENVELLITREVSEFFPYKMGQYHHYLLLEGFTNEMSPITFQRELSNSGGAPTSLGSLGPFQLLKSFNC